MYKEIIKKYINILTKEDIKRYALKENIEVTNEEITIIYNFIKTNYQEILNNNEKSFYLLKQKLKPELYNTIISLYNKYKTKYLT